MLHIVDDEEIIRDSLTWLARSRNIAATAYEGGAAVLAALGAAFVFLLDVDNREGRTWDNAGLVEDVATGSAAGPVAAYLVELGKARRGETFELHQGRFVGRPSLLEVRVGDDDQVQVGGKVQLLAHAQLLCALA